MRIETVIETVIDTVIGWIDQLGWINKFSDEDGQAATKVKSVLFVCWGNVCRSPAAEIILKQEMKRLGINGSRIKSAGICPDSQRGIPSWPMLWASIRRGVWLRPQPRMLRKEDFDDFDVVIAMDREVLYSIETIVKCKPKNVWLLSEFLPENSRIDVPDPMCRPVSVCNRVLDMLQTACKPISQHIQFNQSELDQSEFVAKTTHESVLA